MAYRILVVEDDPDGQEVVSRMLRYHNIGFDAVDNAEEALDLLANNTYSGLIIDLHLPGMDGWTLLKEVQEIYGDVPCVAITAFHSAEVAVDAIEAGFSAYFPKPLEATSFVRELERVLAQ